MSLTVVRSYFRTRMDSLNYKEWKDGFGTEIPDSILHKSYHISSESASVTSNNISSLTYDFPIVIRVFLKGYRKPADAIDDGLSYAEAIVQDICLASNRLTNCIKNIVNNSINIEPIDDSNDNSIIVSIEFNVKLMIEI